MTDYCVVLERNKLSSGRLGPWRDQCLLRDDTLIDYLEQEYAEAWDGLERVLMIASDDGTVTVIVWSEDGSEIEDERQYCIRRLQGGLPD